MVHVVTTRIVWSWEVEQCLAILLPYLPTRCSHLTMAAWHDGRLSPCRVVSRILLPFHLGPCHPCLWSIHLPAGPPSTLMSTFVMTAQGSSGTSAARTPRCLARRQSRRRRLRIWSHRRCLGRGLASPGPCSPCLVSRPSVSGTVGLVIQACILGSCPCSSNVLGSPDDRPHNIPCPRQWHVVSHGSTTCMKYSPASSSHTVPLLCRHRPHRAVVGQHAEQ